jgi:hypothetical protein
LLKVEEVQPNEKLIIEINKAELIAEILEPPPVRPLILSEVEAADKAFMEDFPVETQSQMLLRVFPPL